MCRVRVGAPVGQPRTEAFLCLPLKEIRGISIDGSLMNWAVPWSFVILLNLAFLKDNVCFSVLVNVLVLRKHSCLHNTEIK